MSDVACLSVRLSVYLSVCPVGLAYHGKVNSALILFRSLSGQARPDDLPACGSESAGTDKDRTGNGAREHNTKKEKRKERKKENAREIETVWLGVEAAAAAAVRPEDYDRHDDDECAASQQQQQQQQRMRE